MKDDKSIKDRLLNGLIDRWGVAKFVKVVSASVMGAGTSAIIAESLIPSEPKLIEEKEKINHGKIKNHE